MDPLVRERVRERARHCCEYCRLPQKSAPAVTFHIEHIRARQHGGDDDPVNLALACPDCNRHKGPNVAGVDPESQTITPLFHPRTDVWEMNFQMLDAVISGRTPVGRTTVRLLGMNIDVRVRMREELIEIGEM